MRTRGVNTLFDDAVPGEVIVLAGCHHAGKTSFGKQIALEATNRGVTPLLFLGDPEDCPLREEVRLCRSGCSLRSGAYSLEEILSESRAWRRSVNAPGPVIVDSHRQFSKGRGVHELKKLAFELEVPIFLTSRLTPKRRKPRATDLVDPSLEQAADQVFMLWRPVEDETIVEAFLVKSRTTGPKTFRLDLSEVLRA